MRVWVGVNNDALRNTVYTHSVYVIIIGPTKRDTLSSVPRSRECIRRHTHDLLETQDVFYATVFILGVYTSCHDR